MTSRPRFIAGAVCPRCAAVDRTVVEDEGSVRRRRCIDCDFTETIDGGAPFAVPGGRLDRSREKRGRMEDTTEQPVRIVPKRST